MNQINSEQFDNFKSVAVALKLTVDGLQDFVHGNLRSLHQNIYGKCSVGRCQDNCSKRYGNEFAQWCSTCHAWKRELHQLNRHKKHWSTIKWNKLDTIDFPLSHEETSKVFVQDISHVRQGVLGDLNALMSLFRNLKIFNHIINDTLIADIQRSRNKYFAHNYSLSLHAVEKAQCYNYVIALLKIPDIACTQSSKTSLILLKEMETSLNIPERIIRKPFVHNTIIVFQNISRRETFDRRQENDITIDQLCECDDNEQLNIRRSTEMQKIAQRNRMKMVLQLLLLLVLIAGFTFAIVYGLFSKGTVNTVPVRGCLTVRFDEHWKSDLDFDSYVEEINNESMTERTWIFQEIQTRNDTKRRGILLSADMGFGKSTIVSNIVCADPMSIWYSLRQQVLIYHMCRYDLILSSKPEVFVRNLAGAIVRKIPEIGNAILSDDMALDFLYGKCTIDPVACLEFAVLNKLKHFKDERKHLIIIDAIDECETSGGIDLVGLLYTKISFFPKNFQFLFTSRNIERLVVKFKELQHIDLQLYEQNNLHDIRLYLDKVKEMTNEDKVKLTKISGRNFLHAKLYLQYCKDLSMDECESIPESLEKIYVLNFERVFGEKEDLFEECISIFEVLCSLQNPIDENNLLEVAGFKSNELKRKASRILGNELGHFIKVSNGFISFQHKSISDFLTDSTRKHSTFYVDSQNGHKLFAKYLLNALNATKIDNLVEIVHHAAMSGEPAYENVLIRYVSELQSENFTSNFTWYLISAARDVNCYKTLKLFIKLIPYTLNPTDQILGVDPTRTQNLLSEAAFVAAQYGNEHSLLALLDHGSNIMYSHFNSSVLPVITDKNRHICKYELFCGYNMLHIAAQRGYIKIVKELLHRNVTLLYQYNTMQLNAFHLAAENGHVQVLKVFMNINSSLADSHSLYFASKNGHTKVVVLLQKYVDEKCLPCNVDISWRPTVRIVEEQKYGQLFYEYVVVDTNHLTNLTKINTFNVWRKNLEDIRLLTCDTPLNAAVRNGHIEIVKVLIQKGVGTVNCSIYDGSIPLFTAVKFQRNEIFKLLYNISDISHKCKGISIDQARLTYFEKQIINSRKCPKYAALEHLLAIYDNLELIDYVFNNGHIHWESTDKEGCTPLHYAFCHGSYKFVNFFLFEDRLRLNLSCRSINGSTPFHSAAACQSFILHQYFEKMNERNLTTIPDVVDNQGHSILQYAFNKSISAEELIGIDQIGADNFFFSLFVVVISSHHSLLHKDKQNNNVLHYAAKAGNYWGFLLIKDLKLDEETLLLLLNERNQNNITPLEVAFDALPTQKSFQAVKIPNNCSLTDVFFVNCAANYPVLLTPHEYFIFTVFQYLYKKDKQSGFNLDALLEISINKSRLYPILIMKVYAEREVQYILKRSTVIPFLLSKSNSPYIIELLLNPNKALRCDGEKSALHEIVHNDRNTQWTFHSHSFLNPLFMKYSAKFLDECFDNQGFNLFHRSIMGAHLSTIYYLIDQGMNPWQLSKDNKTALEICILNSPYTNNGNIPEYYTRGALYQAIQYVSLTDNYNIVYNISLLVSFDETARLILLSNKKNPQLIRNLMCDSNHKDLGLIHIAAAKGLFMFLKSARKIYGTDYLSCEDRFGLTPMYIAHIYNQTKIVRWLKILKLQFKRPKNSSENVLLFNIMDNYMFMNEYDWTCLLRYNFKYRGIIRNQVLKCSVRTILNHMPIRYSWVDTNPTIDLLHTSLLLLDLNDLHTNYLQGIQYCRLKYQRDNIYHSMRNLMLFGADDKEFYYLQLLSLVKTIMNAHGLAAPAHVSNSFNDVYGIHYRHFSKLKMRPELHGLWLIRHFSPLTTTHGCFIITQMDIAKTYIMILYGLRRFV